MERLRRLFLLENKSLISRYTNICKRIVKLHYEQLGLQMLELLLPYWKEGVVSLDVETHVERKNEFLTDETILGIALATRTFGALTSGEGIDVKVLVLDEYSDAAEVRLLKALNDWLGMRKRLGIIGYGLRGYDIPLLSMKNRKYKKEVGRPLWKIIDSIQQSVHVDLYFMLKTLYDVRNLRGAVGSQDFSMLPLKRKKSLVSQDFEGKGKAILNMWKNGQGSFEEYAGADAVDTLLLAEYLLKNHVLGEK